MDLINVDKDLSDAAKAGVDEAAIKLDPVIARAISEAAAALSDVLTKALVGRKITISIE